MLVTPNRSRSLRVNQRGMSLSPLSGPGCVPSNWSEGLWVPLCGVFKSCLRVYLCVCTRESVTVCVCSVCRGTRTLVELRQHCGPRLVSILPAFLRQGLSPAHNPPTRPASCRDLPVSPDPPLRLQAHTAIPASLHGLCGLTQVPQLSWVF